MKNGHLLKERFEYYREVFTTRDGLISFFVVGAIWAFVIVNYTDKIYSKIGGFIDFLPSGPIRTYGSYLVFNVALIIIWWVLLWGVINLVNKVFGGNDGQDYRGR